MRRFSLPVSFVFLALLCSTQLRAKPSLPPIFSEGAIFQRQQPIEIWGSAEPSEKIAVSLNGFSATTITTEDGRWSLQLPAMEACATPLTLIVKGAEEITVSDILIGEVWLCSGQSNMEWPLIRSSEGLTEVNSANYPLIRHARVQRTMAETPTTRAPIQWETCTPDKAGNFSAIAYYFAKEIHRKLRVPVGIINSSYSASPIESWMSQETMASDPDFSVVTQRWLKTVENYPNRLILYEKARNEWQNAAKQAATKGPKNLNFFRQTHPEPLPPVGPYAPGAPSLLFNGMIYPLIPYGIKGVLWYQGEQNALYPEEYKKLFPAFIQSLRNYWKSPTLPFYFVQLASFAAPNDPSGRIWAEFRHVQEQTLSMPHTAMALSLDLGEPRNIHPANKKDIGARLAAIAKAKLYGMNTVEFEGPQVIKVSPEQSGLRLRFNHAGTGLVAHHKPINAMEIAGADNIFYPASAAIEGDTILVKSPAVKTPTQARYAWSNAPLANLHNGNGLPTAPFWVRLP